jgi:predicted metal-dependent phosphoesterase TrpH
MLSRIREGRSDRNREILRRLNALGIPIEWSDVERWSSDGVVGRPHFAQALVEVGAASSFPQAFKKLLGRGCPGYCERYRPEAADAIAEVRAAGGVAVLAHPVTLKLSPSKLRTVLVGLVDSGLQGIEVYYPEHNPDHECIYGDMVRDFGLVATGGSDYHGTANPLIKLGRGFGRLRVPPGTVDKLRALAGA